VALVASVPLTAAASTVSVLNDGGFEDPSGILPTALRLSWTSAAYGRWAVGDPMAAVGATNGITPHTGSEMLYFSPTGGVSSDVYQPIDVSAYAAQIDAGLVTADLGAFFNALGGGTVGLDLYGVTSSAPLAFGGETLLGGKFNNFTVDGDRSTWQQFQVNHVLLTAGTRFLFFGLHAPTSSAGTYADDASMTLTINDGATSGVPEPGTVALVLGGLLGMAWTRHRRT
jgi:hypothetical protein